MSRVGLVLGGGGITGAAYEMAALMALELATGWDPNDADVVIGTSSGSFVTALVRNSALNLDSLVLPEDERGDVAHRIRSHVYTKGPGLVVGDWVRHGLVPGVRRPGLTMLLGSPARYHAGGLVDWVESHIGRDAAHGWPARPTAVVAHDLRAGRRVVFGTDAAPDVTLGEAVAASSAIPVLFRPYQIGEGIYVDGGVSSGTHADLVLANPLPLDLVIVVAPMSSEVQRKRARFHEKMFDRVGSRSLGEELAMIASAWPACDVVVLTPTPSVQNASRPNPMDANKAVPTFMRTLIAMKRTLARPEVWDTLEAHIGRSRRHPTAVAAR
jgi:NTE family protein